MSAAETIRLKHFANAVAIGHALWLTLMVTALPISLMWGWYRYVGLALILATVISWAIWDDCPLFIWENGIRKRYDPKEEYNGSFSSHYLRKIFSINIPDKVFTIAGYIYAALFILLVLLELRNIH